MDYFPDESVRLGCEWKWIWQWRPGRVRRCHDAGRYPSWQTSTCTLGSSIAITKNNQRTKSSWQAGWGQCAFVTHVSGTRRRYTEAHQRNLPALQFLMAISVCKVVADIGFRVVYIVLLGLAHENHRTQPAGQLKDVSVVFCFNKDPFQSIRAYDISCFSLPLTNSTWPRTHELMLTFRENIVSGNSAF